MPTLRIPREAMERFGLCAIIESKRVVLPLKGVECDFTVLGGILEVGMRQVFRQENEKPLDCEYLFPLPADAAVFSCEADINGRTIRMQVRERQEAVRLAAEKKAEGFRTALVESERENLFTLSLGNVQPNDLVIIELKYFQPLRSLGEMRSVEIPFCPGVRYIPGRPLLRGNKGKGIVDDTDEVPDASRISPVRIDGGHPDAAYIDVRGSMDAKFLDDGSLTSPSHLIAVHDGGEQVRISLSDKGEVPNRDFVLWWKERKAEKVTPRVWMATKGKETYALMEVRAPVTAAAERGPVDFYFLVDRSGSMAGQKWQKAAEALTGCVGVLGPEDRAMITLFETHFQDYAEEPLLAQKLLQDGQFLRIESVGTGGGTEMMPALKHVLELSEKHSRKREKNLILITDAQIGNEQAILQLMQSAPGLAVHCFGIDIALNDSLLLALCRQQGGTFHSLNPNADIQKAVSELGKTLGKPVLLDLELSKGWEIAEARIPNLYAGQIHFVSARGNHGNSLELMARTPTGEKVRMQFEQQSGSNDGPYVHWFRAAIARCLAVGKNQEAIRFSVQSNLICRLTAFVAWDEAEKVAVARHQLVQPSMNLLTQRLCAFVSRSPRACNIMSDTWGMNAEHLAEKSTIYEQLHSRTRAENLVKIVRKAITDEIELRRKISELCHRNGVKDWQKIVDTIFNWIAKASADERAERIKAVDEMLEELERFERVKGTPIIPNEKVPELLLNVLNSFSKNLEVGK